MAVHVCEDVSKKVLLEQQQPVISDDTIKSYLIHAVSLFRSMYKNNSKASRSSPSSSPSSSSEESSTCPERPERCFCGKHAFSEKDCVWIKDRPFYLMEVLESGSSGKVYHATEPSHMCAAIKKVPLADVHDDQIVELKNEVNILQRLDNSPFVVKYLEGLCIIDKNEVLWIAMEAGLEDMHTRLQFSFGRMKFNVIMHYWIQMLRCVDAIHKRGVIHLDLKPENFVFFGKEESETLKVIDFGFSNVLDADGSVSKECCFGTAEHMSPEHIVPAMDSKRNYKLTSKADIWSLGTILYLMMYARTPFEHHARGQPDRHAEMAIVMQAIAEGSKVRYSSRKDVYLNNVIKRCLVVDPSKRPTAAMLLKEATDPSARPQYGPQIIKDDCSKPITYENLEQLDKSMKRVALMSNHYEEVSFKKLAKASESCSNQILKNGMGHLPQLELIQ
uniref:Protein kinase domain-containing protein n=2 Tax=Ditylenchus dipsaci TaxID=166011 RepID=A0A915ET01_9BILA